MDGERTVYGQQEANAGANARIGGALGGGVLGDAQRRIQGDSASSSARDLAKQLDDEISTYEERIKLAKAQREVIRSIFGF